MQAAVEKRVCRLYHTYPVTFSFSGTFPELLQANFLLGSPFFAILFDFPSGFGAGCRRVGAGNEYHEHTIYTFSD